MSGDGDLRQHVLTLLDGRGAHLSFDSAMEGWAAATRAVKPDGGPHSAWQLLEHMRIAQRDILDFCVNSSYEELEFPKDYWPPGGAVPDDVAWNESLDGFRRDLANMKKLVVDPSTDLFERLPHGTGQTILREAFVVADHNAYHLGQLVLVRRLLDVWHDPKLTI